MLTYRDIYYIRDLYSPKRETINTAGIDHIHMFTDVFDGTGLVPLDVADLTDVVQGAKSVHVLSFDGENLAAEAEKMQPIPEAKKALINFSADGDFTLDELNAISDVILGKLCKDASVLWGFKQAEKNRVSVIVSE